MKFGRLAPHPEETHPRLKLGPALDLSQIQVPDVVDYVSKVTDWPMFENDQLGCCTISAAGHMEEAWSTYGAGSTVEVTDADIIHAYSDVSGYDPSTGKNDNGAVLQDVLGYWRRTGIGGHKVLAFAQLDPNNTAEVKAALWLFGHVYVGIQCPKSAQEQYHNGQPWDVVADDGGIAGGHAIDLGYADPSAYQIVSWGEAITMTPAFYEKYTEEAWVVVSQEWIDATGGSPPGLDTDHLNQQYTAITGRRGPFPANPPAPVASDWSNFIALWREAVSKIEAFLKTRGG